MRPTIESSSSAVDAEVFLNSFEKDIRQGTGALFVGSGLSIESGLPSWDELMDTFLVELCLDKCQIPYLDPTALAQYYVNKQGSRTGLISRIKDLYGRALKPSLSYRIVANLPVNVFWTTNFDKLLEESMKQCCPGTHSPNVVVEYKDLTTNTPSEKTIYKMHGCVTRNHITITKDDYELYQTNNQAKLEALLFHLNAYTFLFVGFGLRDPNINYILGKIRALHKYDEVQRTHYIIVKKPTRAKNEKLVDYKFRCNLYSFWVEDLKRYGLRVVEVENYNEVPDLLKRLLRRFLAMFSLSDDSQIIRKSEGWLDEEGYRKVVKLAFEVRIRNAGLKSITLKNFSAHYRDQVLDYANETRLSEYDKPKTEYKISPNEEICLRFPFIEYKFDTWKKNVTYFYQFCGIEISRLGDSVDYDSLWSFYNNPYDYLDLHEGSIYLDFDLSNLHCKQKIALIKNGLGQVSLLEME